MTHQIVEEPVPLVYKKILKEKSCGELTIRIDKSEKKILFLDGNLKFSRSNVINERLGEILFKLGKINQTQFWNIHKLIEGKKEKVGKILVQKNILSQKDVFFGLLHQIRTIATSVFEFYHGEWDFQEEIPDIPSDIDFNIELPGIIMEGMRKIHNFSYYKNKFSHHTPEILKISQSANKILTQDDQKFLQFLSDFNNIPCEQIIPNSRMSEDIFWRKIVLLHLLNIIDFIEIKADKQEDKNIEELSNFYEKLQLNKTDYYELLGQKNTASQNEIKEVYFSLAKKFHPDRISNVGNPEIKEKANFVFATINKAYETLSNEKKRQEYDEKGYKEAEDENESEKNVKEKARILYLKAKTLYNKGQYWEAATLLDEAVKIDNYKPAYFLLLGLSQMNIITLRKTAVANLQKASEMEPWNAEPLTAMGMLFLSEGLNIRAETFFKKALSINPNHILARKKLEEITKSSSKKISFSSFFTKKKK